MRGTIVSGTNNSGSTLSDPSMMMGTSALKKRYNDLVIYDGLLLFGASACVAYVRWCHAKERGQWSWKA